MATPICRQQRCAQKDIQIIAANTSERVLLTMQVAKALSNLAALLDDSQNITEAETIYHRSLSIREDALGEDNIEVC